jgi:hypothetical protein
MAPISAAKELPERPATIHQVDDEDLGAEILQLLSAHVGNDHADQEGDQRHDRNGGDAGVVDVASDRGGPQPARTYQRPQRGHAQMTEEGQRAERIVPAAHGVTADGLYRLRGQ